MKFARIFSRDWKDRFYAYNLSEAQYATGKCLFDRMPLANGQYQPNSAEHQQNPSQEVLSTHKITCRANFDVEKASFLVVNFKRFIVTDWQQINDCYILNLHYEGAYIGTTEGV